MKRFAFYACAALVVSLSLICEPSLTPWRPNLSDALALALAFASAASLIAIGKRCGATTLALISVALQAALIRFNYVKRNMLAFSTTSDFELILTNVIFCVAYIGIAMLTGLAILRALPNRTSPTN